MDNKEKPESSIDTEYSFYSSNPYYIPSGFAGVRNYISPLNYGLGNRIFNKPANIPIHMPIDFGVLRTSDKENKTNK